MELVAFSENLENSHVLRVLGLMDLVTLHSVFLSVLFKEHNSCDNSF